MPKYQFTGPIKAELTTTDHANVQIDVTEVTIDTGQVDLQLEDIKVFSLNMPIISVTIDYNSPENRRN